MTGATAFRFSLPSKRVFVSSMIRLGAVAASIDWAVFGFMLYFAFDIRRIMSSLPGGSPGTGVPLAAMTGVWVVCVLALPSLWMGRIRGGTGIRLAQRVALLLLVVVGASMAAVEVTHFVIFSFKSGEDAVLNTFSSLLVSLGSLALLLRDRSARRAR